MEGPPRTLIACVSEDRPDWFQRVLSLALSVRRFAGSLRDAPFVALFVDGVEDRYVRSLGDLGVEVRVVPRVDERYPYANKLRMLELAEEDNFQTLVALDCDVVVLGDFASELSVTHVRAKPADCDFLEPSDWLRIFSRLGLPVPERTCRTTTFGQWTYPYFNSGVVLVPRERCAALLGAWRRYIDELQDVYRSDERLARNRTYTDQIALSCGLISERIPVDPLPVRMNFPTHLRVEAGSRGGAFPPLIVHHHDLVDSAGFIRPSGYPQADGALARFNAARAQHLGISPPRNYRLSSTERIKRELRSRPFYHSPAALKVRGIVRRVTG